VVDVGTREHAGRREPEEQCRRRGPREREQQHAAIERDFIQARKGRRRERDDEPNTDTTDQKSDDATSEIERALKQGK